MGSSYAEALCLPRSGAPTLQLFRSLQHWLTGRGPCLQVADFVPDTQPIRQWAETFPWAALVLAVDRSFAQRVPKLTTRGRPPVAPRGLLALERLKQALGCADEQICSRWRTALAVMSACGLTEVQVHRTQEHVVRPDVLAQFRHRLDEPLMAELLALQAATALADGLVSPAHLVVDTFPSEQGSQRVNDAATLDKAPTKSSRSSRPSPPRAPAEAPCCRGKPSHASRPSSR
jgi:AcrR family transcriptional regulator